MATTTTTPAKPAKPAQPPPATSTPTTGAGSLFSAEELQFIHAMVQATGGKLDPNVAGAWVLQEEGKTSQNQHPAYGAYNFLNVGIQSASRTFGASDAVWTNPVSAGTATGKWLLGEQGAVPNYSSSASRYAGIFSATTAEDQVKAIQASGFAQSGETSLGALLDEVSSAGTLGALKDPGWSIGTHGWFGVGVKNGPNGTTVQPDTSPDTGGALPGVSSLDSLASSGSSLLGAVTSAGFWVRVAEIVGGFVLVTIALRTLTGIDATPGAVAGKVV